MVLVEAPFPANGTDCACTDDAAAVETPSRTRAISVRCIWYSLQNDARPIIAPNVIEMRRTDAWLRMPDQALCFTESAFGESLRDGLPFFCAFARSTATEAMACRRTTHRDVKSAARSAG